MPCAELLSNCAPPVPPAQHQLRRLLNAGADKTSFNSAAIANPEVINAVSAKYGAQCIVVAIDAKRRSEEDALRLGANGEPVGPGWDVYSHGGRKNTGLDALAWAKEMAQRGAGEILLTSMDRDGTRSGFDLALTRAVSDAVSVPVIASGGVGSLDDLADGIQQGGADAVLAASIFHYGQHTVGEAKALMAARGIAAKPFKKRQLAPAGAPREVRIVGGQWKRSKLPVADRPGLRPTPDRVRETLFNWLGQDLDGWRVLDAFAGSGALGFEAASRGASEVLLLEREGELVRILQASKVRLKAANLRVEPADAITWMARSAPGRFELVMLDPPFDAGLFEPAIKAAAALLVPG
eukprot:gene31904-39419_t